MPPWLRSFGLACAGSLRASRAGGGNRAARPTHGAGRAPSRRTWISLVLGELVLFALANLTAKNSSHPGTVSNVFFIVCIIGAVLLVTLALITVVKSRRGASR